MADPIIHLQHVSMSRSNTLVLHDFSWSTYPREHWFIMGNNGCGKTTLMEILMGYLWPQEGSVNILGQEYGKTFIPDLRKKIGYVSPWVFERMGGEVLVQDVVASGIDASVGKAEEITGSLETAVWRQLRFFGMENLFEKKFGQLSSGQQFKAVLARAMVHSPKLLILDEPFSRLDMGSRLQMYALIEKISRRRGGPQVILVTHHIDDITSVFTHGLIIDRGRIQAIGERKHVLHSGLFAKTLGVTPATLKRYLNRLEHLA